MKETRFNFSVT